MEKTIGFLYVDIINNMNTVSQYKDNFLEYVSIEHPNFKVILANHAASLYEVWLDNKLMTVQLQDSALFKDPWVFFGKIVGRVAGRIANGRLEIDGKVYQLSTNEMGNTLHGGWDGISQQVFKIKEIKNEPDKTIVTYHVTTLDGQSGWPGKLSLDVSYIIPSDKEDIEIVIEAICDKKSPINITNHIFFSLGENCVDNLRLKVNANKYVFPRELDLLPIEERNIIPCLDFNKFKTINKDINDPAINVGRTRGYDHFFSFKETNPNIVQIQLENDKYHLDVFTDYSGAKIYSDNFMDEFKCKNTSNFFHRGLAIEAQCSDLHNLIEEPNTKVRHWIKFSLSRK